MSCASCCSVASVSSSFRDLDSASPEHPRGYSVESGTTFPTATDRGPTSPAFDPADRPDAITSTAEPRSRSPSPEISRGRGEPNKVEGDEGGDRRRAPYNPSLGDDGGCASCSISLPSTTVSQLPGWAPGSPKTDGIGRNGSPVMRTTEKIFGHWSPPAESDGEDEPKFPHESPPSCGSDSSRSSHPHELIYRTTASLIDPNTYAILRRATIRALSCEQLPRGLTAGALSFGDPTDGYTVAYKFRLPDPFARGCQRYYALLALAGPDAARTYKATPIIWRAFRRIAEGIMARTEHVIGQSQPGADARPAGAGAGTGGGTGGGWKPALPVSSFLTARTVDPDGYPRRSGGSNVRARGLAEMVGDELIFAHVHGEFTYLLHNLGKHLGGMSVQPPTMDGDGHVGLSLGHVPSDSSEDGRGS